MKRYRPIGVVAALLLLASCASQPATVQLATACDAYASALFTLTVRVNEGKISQDGIATIRATFPIASEVCNPAAPPADAATALARLQGALDRLTLLQGAR